MTEPIDAILPAAGRIAGAFAEEAGAEVKALIHLRDRTLLEQALDSAMGAGIRKVVAIGPRELAERSGIATEEDSRSGLSTINHNCPVLPEAESGPANIMRGMRWLQEQAEGPPPERVLILTTDLPFVIADAVRGFLEACPPEADLCLPVIARADFEARFPGSRNTYVRMKDGEWTMGCAFLVNPRALIASQSQIERVFAARKSQLAMARLLGPFFIARFLTRTLTVRHVEARCRAIVGCSGAAVMGCDPALAYDIDELEELRYARSMLAVHPEGKPR